MHYLYLQWNIVVEATLQKDLLSSFSQKVTFTWKLVMKSNHNTNKFGRKCAEFLKAKVFTKTPE